MRTNVQPWDSPDQKSVPPDPDGVDTIHLKTTRQSAWISLKRFAELNEISTTFIEQIADLIDLPELRESRTRRHHFSFTEYDHVLEVSGWAFRIGQFVRCDARTCARAGLLHDVGSHWFDTRAPVSLARRLAETDGVCHAIQAHTILPILPRTVEAIVVVIADFLTTASECGRACVGIQRSFRSAVRRGEGEVSAGW